MLLTAGLVGGLLTLINGPWLRVERVAWAGEHYTEVRDLERAISSLDGMPLLLLDATGLAAQLRRLPAVAGARVEAVLPDAVRITIVEKVPTFVWQTSAVRLLGVPDGTLIGQVALGADLPASLAALPLVDDRRAESRDIIVGDRIDAPTLAAALHLSGVEPAALGSTSPDLEVRLTDDDGFLLASRQPAWQADFGFYPPRAAGEQGT
ncbi:MAG: FtsQ-type POTRA domain-containing protein, partial [Chloroflexota bacterium]|nr:FtsQ-type POTRA domain-containing protein [Chloroflexota bacterium]